MSQTLDVAIAIFIIFGGIPSLLLISFGIASRISNQPYDEE